ncbi:MAG: M15 family metallopeptidase, partial [Chitinophagaceae bacterium]
VYKHRGIVALEGISGFYTNLLSQFLPVMTNKISNRFYIKEQMFLIFSTLLLLHAGAQDTSYTRPRLTNKWDEYQKQVKQDSLKKMVELKSIIPGIVYDLRYATINNFMRRLMYPAGTTVTFLRLPAANALQKIQSELINLGLGLKIYDAYRPYAVTVKFWELIRDERYVAHPKNGSGHNRGVTVDLTLIDLKTRKEINMGTGFDNFSDTAHHNFTNISQGIRENRSLLKTLMEKYGFKSYNEEWWHYSWPNAGKFEILDIEFKKLKKNL